MAYIILSTHGEEFDRIELSGPIVIGRSAECDLAVRDILLSRLHCRLEPAGRAEQNRWQIVDLQSRNGSHVNWKAITSQVLCDRDKVRVGRTWMEYREGPFEPAQGSASSKKSKLVRPADPHEALAGTISDFVYVEPEGDTQEFDGTPSPMPHVDGTVVPTTLYTPVLHELSESVSGISVVAPPQTRRLATAVRINLPKRAGQSFQADLSLQADARQVSALHIAPDTKPSRQISSAAVNILLGCGVIVATGMVLVSGWIIANG